MKKLKILMSKIGKYLREVSVVVIGVAITLLASNTISNRNEQRDMALCLHAIKVELERNVIAFDNYANRLQKSLDYAIYIQSHDEKSISQDSIQYYASSDMNGIGWQDTEEEIVFIENAFDMFKNVGIMRYVNDKDAWIFIWDIYNKIENTQKHLNGIVQTKRELMLIDLQLRTEGKMTVPMKAFYSLDATSTMIKLCKRISREIKEVLTEWETMK